MVAPRSSIRVQRLGTILTCQVIGWGTMPKSLSLRKFVECARADGVTEFRVDLRHCFYLDSTFLGTLVFIKRLFDGIGPNRSSLISPTPECRQLLAQMKLDRLFHICSMDELSETCWQELPDAAGDMNSLRNQVVQVHEELANLPGEAGEPFREMVRGLKEEMDKDRTK